MQPKQHSNRMRYILTILAILITARGEAQTFVGSIHAGDKLPDSINVGGYTEQPQKNCSCKIYEIRSRQDNITARSKNGSHGEIIGIHYNKDYIVTGVIKLTMRFSVADAKQAYERQLPYWRTFAKEYPGAKFIMEHQADPNKENDIDYFAYSLDNGKKIRTVGYIQNVLSAEDYLTNFSYKPKFLIKSK